MVNQTQYPNNSNKNTSHAGKKKAEWTYTIAVNIRDIVVKS